MIDDLLLHDLGEELFIPANRSVQLVVSLLNRLALSKTLLGKRAGEESNGDVGGCNSFGVCLGGYDCRRRPDCEAIAYRPVLDGLDEGVLFLGLEGGRVWPACERDHDAEIYWNYWSKKSHRRVSSEENDNENSHSS